MPGSPPRPRSARADDRVGGEAYPEAERVAAAATPPGRGEPVDRIQHRAGTLEFSERSEFRKSSRARARKG